MKRNRKRSVYGSSWNVCIVWHCLSPSGTFTLIHGDGLGWFAVKLNEQKINWNHATQPPADHFISHPYCRSQTATYSRRVRLIYYRFNMREPNETTMKTSGGGQDRKIKIYRKQKRHFLVDVHFLFMRRQGASHFVQSEFRVGCKIAHCHSFKLVGNWSSLSTCALCAHSSSAYGIHAVAAAATIWAYEMKAIQQNASWATTTIFSISHVFSWWLHQAHCTWDMNGKPIYQATVVEIINKWK